MVSLIPSTRSFDDLLFGVLDRSIATARVRFLMPDGAHDVGRSARPSEEADVVVRVTDPDFSRRALTLGNLGLGESYLDGGFTFEVGTLADLLLILARSNVDEHVRRDLGLSVRIAARRVKDALGDAGAHVALHYGAGNDVFELILDETMGYTCGYQKTPEDTLRQLQENKYDRICEKVRLREGQTLLDIGCGWGGLVIHAAQKFGARDGRDAREGAGRVRHAARPRPRRRGPRELPLLRLPRGARPLRRGRVGRDDRAPLRAPAHGVRREGRRPARGARLGPRALHGPHDGEELPRPVHAEVHLPGLDAPAPELRGRRAGEAQPRRRRRREHRPGLRADGALLARQLARESSPRRPHALRRALPAHDGLPDGALRRRLARGRRRRVPGALHEGLRGQPAGERRSRLTSGAAARRDLYAARPARYSSRAADALDARFATRGPILRRARPTWGARARFDDLQAALTRGAHAPLRLLETLGHPDAVKLGPAGLRRTAYQLARAVLALGWVARRREPAWAELSRAWEERAGTRAPGDVVPAGRFHADDRLELLVDNAASFARRADLYASARERIDLATHYIHADRVGRETADALRAAVRRGVRVRVIVDGYVERMKEHEGLGVTAILEDLEAAGVEVRRFDGGARPYDMHHRKLLVVDSEAAVVGGRNIADHYADDAWRDVDLLVRGPSAALAVDAFERTFHGDTDPDDEGALFHLTSPARLAEHPTFVFLLRALASAERTVDVEHAYVLSHPAIDRAIERAVRRGVRVRLVTNSAESNDLDYMRYATHRELYTLFDAGVELWLRRGAGRTLHSKYVVVDGRWVCLGSGNLDYVSPRLSTEVNLHADSPALAAELARFFDAGLAEATRVEARAELEAVVAASRTSRVVDLLFRDIQ